MEICALCALIVGFSAAGRGGVRSVKARLFSARNVQGLNVACVVADESTFQDVLAD